MAHGYVKKGEEPRFNYNQYCDCHKLHIYVIIIVLCRF